MSDLQNFMTQLEQNKLMFVNNEFKNKIINTIDNFIPKLNLFDKNILNTLVTYIIDIISYKYNFKPNSDYYYQWLQNNNRDIKGVILLLLPFIDDKEKDDGFLFNKLEYLNQLLYNSCTNTSPQNILKQPRDNILNKHFKFGKKLDTVLYIIVLNSGIILSTKFNG